MEGVQQAANWINPWLALIMLSLGLFALVSQKHVIKQVLGLVIMLQGALLIVIDAGRLNDMLDTAQALVVTALVVEAIVMAIILVLIVNVARYHPEGQVDDLNELKG